MRVRYAAATWYTTRRSGYIPVQRTVQTPFHNIYDTVIIITTKKQQKACIIVIPGGVPGDNHNTTNTNNDVRMLLTMH